MRIEYHALDHSPLGSQRFVTAFHFGDETAARKIYIQTSLHADELPGALVAYHLRPMLEELEAAGGVQAHIVLVPLCNPLGLAQTVQYEAKGRFDLFTGRNFNRLVGLPLYEQTLLKLRMRERELYAQADEAAVVRFIRSLMKEVLDEYSPQVVVDVLQHTLVKLAFDADVVLDLHCDERAVMHVYTLPQLWQRVEPLARYLGSECQLLSEDSQSQAFDEFLSTFWLKLSREFPDAPIPCACASVTVELRGQDDLSHQWARQDAHAILGFLHHAGDVRWQDAPAMPELKRPAHPLAGMAYVNAPTSGVAVFHVKPGHEVTRGQLLVELIDPIHQISTPVVSPTDGIVFACHRVNYAQMGITLVSVSGLVDLGQGEYLSP